MNLSDNAIIAYQIFNKCSPKTLHSLLLVSKNISHVAKQVIEKKKVKFEKNIPEIYDKANLRIQPYDKSIHKKFLFALKWNKYTVTKTEYNKIIKYISDKWILVNFPFYKNTMKFIFLDKFPEEIDVENCVNLNDEISFCDIVNHINIGRLCFNRYGIIFDCENKEKNKRFNFYRYCRFI